MAGHFIVASQQECIRKKELQKELEITQVSSEVHTVSFDVLIYTIKPGIYMAKGFSDSHLRTAGTFLGQ